MHWHEIDNGGWYINIKWVVDDCGDVKKMIVRVSSFCHSLLVPSFSSVAGEEVLRFFSMLFGRKKVQPITTSASAAHTSYTKW